MTKQLEVQLAELNAKLEQSAREIVELNSVKSRSQAEIAEHSRQIEEAESQINQLTKLKQNLGKQLEEAKASLEEESRLRAKFQTEARNFQVSETRFARSSPFQKRHSSPVHIYFPLTDISLQFLVRDVLQLPGFGCRRLFS